MSLLQAGDSRSDSHTSDQSLNLVALRAKLEPCTFTPAAKANPDVDDENDDGVVIADQTSIKSCSAAALLRAKRVPCEPSEDFVCQFGEQ